MPITNRESGTNVDEIADGIYRISTPVPPNVIPGGFTFNQYLIVDESPLLFHSGLRKMFGLVREAVASVIPVERLRYIGLSHVEADECGSINEWLAAAPQAAPLCGRVAASVSMEDLADRLPRGIADGEGSPWAIVKCAGSIRRICPMHGNVDFFLRNAPAPFCAATFSVSQATKRSR
jgi:glyoxylase-like metal-dependent hydrolase (beta-lactamase superfamily II)